MKNLISILTFLLSINCFAWGPQGQTVTVMVAEKNLTPAVSAQIRTILDGRSLSEFASWADMARNSNEWKYTAGWHYISVEDLANYEHSSEGTPDDILSAISLSISKIKNGTKPEKAVYLKFLAHMIGDLHQPLHIGKAEDRGGNSVFANYNGKELKLHGIWDSAILQSAKLSNEQLMNKLQGLNFSANSLTEPFSTKKAVEEGFNLRPFVYGFQNGKIDSKYEAKAMTVIEERIWTGGLRLASLLNSIFTQQ